MWAEKEVIEGARAWAAKIGEKGQQSVAASQMTSTTSRPITGRGTVVRKRVTVVSPHFSGKKIVRDAGTNFVRSCWDLVGFAVLAEQGWQ